MPAAARIERLSRATTSWCDDILDFVVLAFASWTTVYHVALVADVGALWAGAAGIAALVPVAWVAFRMDRGESVPPLREIVTSSRRWQSAARAGSVLAALSAATLFAWTTARWRVIWPFVFISVAGAAFVMGRRAFLDRPNRVGKEAQPGPVSENEVRTWPGTLVALVWALALATMALFIRRGSADDTYYVRVSTWIAEYGDLPLRDVLFSDQALPALIYPPLSSLEALVGTFGYAFGLAAPDIAYFVVGPIGCAAIALTTWRLVRAWRLPMAPLALSIAIVFLLFNAQPVREAGGAAIAANTFLVRTWQGKFIFAAAFVALLLALLHEYAENPGKRTLTLLGAAGVAGVGLTSTALFVIPVVAAGCLGPLLRRSTKQAAIGIVVTVAYPFAAAVVTALVGGHAVKPNPYLAPGVLIRIVLGTGFLAFVVLLAILVAPTLVRSAVGARMATGTALLVVLLYAPPAPKIVSEVTGLGRVQWRFLWALPIAVFVAVLATAPLARARSPAVRALPAAVLVTALALWGSPLWERVIVDSVPKWKRPLAELAATREIVATAEDGDVILAPRKLSQTILVTNGSLTTVAPRESYVEALLDVPTAHALERLRLFTFVEDGLGAIGPGGDRVSTHDVARALRVVGVDLACVDDPGAPERETLSDAGYAEVLAAETLVCFRAGGQG